jgi:hypothetical protein
VRRVSPWLIVTVIVGLILPLAVAVAIVIYGLPKATEQGARADWGLVVAFGKGIGLGLVMGSVISALVIGLVLGLRSLLGR